MDKNLHADSLPGFITISSIVAANRLKDVIGSD